MKKKAPPTSKQKNDKIKNLKTKVQKTKVKLLSAYYGNPVKDMRLICVTGTTGKVEVAHYVHGILKAAGHHVAVLASEKAFRVGVLHKFFSDAWRAGASHVVVTAPADSLRDNVFFGLPVYVAAMTNFVPATLDAPTAEEFVCDEKTLFDMNPEIVVLNRDDTNYEAFEEFKGSFDTLTYGANRDATLRIESSQLYKKGAEATLSYGSLRWTVATYVTGETAVSYMAAAAAIASALKISTEDIAEGIASYEPEDI